MTFSNVIYGSRLLSSLYCKVSQLRNPGFRAEVERRSKLSIFDYEDIAQPLPKCYFEPCTDNNCFGIGYSLRNYANYSRGHIDAWIEHGYFYADAVSELSVASYAKYILTFGEHRQMICQKLIPKKQCVKVGPYIHYAEDYVNDDEFETIKTKLGRTLLVFPIHSGTGAQVHYEKEDLFRLVERVSGSFDTILFSLFWSDVNGDYVKEIEDRGYRVVCSGHRFDPHFLSRQKTIIKLADVTMSNGIGTNLAYCTFFHKPHWLVHQESTLTGNNSTGDKHREYEERNKNNSSVRPLLYEAFKDYSEELTQDQYDLCSGIFGFREIKTPAEMNTLFNSLK